MPPRSSLLPDTPSDRNDRRMNTRTIAILFIGIMLGTGGTTAGFLLTEASPTPSLYTNSNGADVLRRPYQHIAAAVQYRGTVVGDHPLVDGAIIALRIDQTIIAAHVYDPTWAPAHIGQPLEIQGHIRGTLGDPISAAGIPITAPLAPGKTLIDVTAAVGPHRKRLISAAGRGDATHRG
jgi:hypothetical protein